jgi:hypothetical protein
MLTIDIGVFPLMERLSAPALTEIICQPDIAVTAPVAALLTGTSPARMRRLLDGVIPSRSTGGQVRVLLADLGAWSGQREFDVADWRRCIRTVSRRRGSNPAKRVSQESKDRAAAA